MSYLDLPERPQPRVSPQFLMGAVSPLWGYFGAAAAGGVAFWWMTRWARPVNLEALLGAMPGADAVMEEAVELVEAAVDTLEPLPDVIAEAGAEAEAEAREAALEPPIDAFEAPPAEALGAAPEPVVAAAPEPVVDAAPEAVVETAPERAAEPSPLPAVDAAIEEAAAPAKPRGRRGASPSTEA